MISQEYFDEVCLENSSLFDLTPSDAVQETLTQLGLDVDNNGAHLALSFPTEGVQERRDRQVFCNALKKVEKEKIRDLVTMQELAEYANKFPALFLVRGGYRILLNAIAANDSSAEIVQTVLETLESVLQSQTTSAAWRGKHRVGLQVAVTGDNVQALLLAYQSALLNSEYSAVQHCQTLLFLFYECCKNCETNKQKFMSNDGVSLVPLLQSSWPHTTLRAAIGRLVSVMCIYDDTTVEMASTHTYVQQMSVLVPLLLDNVKMSLNDDRTDDVESKTTASVVAALRALSIQESIIQTMISLGLSDIVLQLIVRVQSEPLATSTWAWVRNLCANDRLKTQFCNETVISSMLQAMTIHIDSASLQEHGCGVIAAMALRQPNNAQRLVVAFHAHEAVLTAMQRHGACGTVQRQGALALRNLVSRSPELQPILLESGAKEVLMAAAQQHMGCQDEVYAALRDLGIQVQLLNVETRDGKPFVQPRQMFGEQNPNFRPVFD